MATDKFKLVLIGNTDVGKSSLLSRFTNDTFTEVASPTVGVDFISHRIENDGKITRLQIWDTSGQERFRSLLASYLRDASGVIIVFDVTNAESFQNVKTWSQEIDDYVPTEVNKMLVGNKCDLTSERVIDYAQAKDLADSLSIPYVETSAKNSSNVQQAFLTIINHMISITSTILAETSNINSESNMKPLENITVTDAEYNRVFKLVLLGDSGVGKSSLLRRFINDAFDDTFSSTIGIDFISHVIKHNGEATVLQIWDTAGQERFRSLISSYCRNAKGVIVVFDVTNAESFENVTRWLQEIDEDRKNDVKTLLVGNKYDLTAERVVDHAQAKNLANSLSIPYVEASAKNTTNVELTFMSLISEITSSESSVIIDNTNIKIGLQEKSKKTTSGFC